MRHKNKVIAALFVLEEPWEIIKYSSIVTRIISHSFKVKKQLILNGIAERCIHIWLNLENKEMIVRKVSTVAASGRMEVPSSGRSPLRAWALTMFYFLTEWRLCGHLLYSCSSNCTYVIWHFFCTMYPKSIENMHGMSHAMFRKRGD